MPHKKGNPSNVVGGLPALLLRPSGVRKAKDGGAQEEKKGHSKRRLFISGLEIT